MENNNEEKLGGGISNVAFTIDATDPQGKPNSEATKNENNAELYRKLASEFPKSERKKILKNIIAISFSFTLLFTAYQSMANLQSSINAELGTASLATVYGALVVSCIFLPTLLINKFTAKWTLAFAMLCYSTYIAAQFYPEYYTLIPGAIIVGLGAAPMWSAKCTYLTQVGNLYAEMVGESAETIVTRFFGIFFLFFQSSQVWGNLISSTVLSSGDQKDVAENASHLWQCGTEYCPAEFVADNSSGGSAGRPEDDKLYTLAGIYLACALCSSILVGFLVDPLTRYGEKDREGSSNQLTGFRLLYATMLHLKNPYQILIIPLTVWSGIEQGYISADFTQAFVTCGYGVHNVGYVMICFGVMDAIFSLSLSPVVKYVGRVPVFTFGACVNLAMIITMFVWHPTPTQPIMFFVIAGLWGVADAVWQTQINSFYGILFPGNEEAAFSNYRLWESIGFIIAYAYSEYLCLDAKLWAVFGFLVCGMTGYYIIEVCEFRRKRGNKSIDMK